MKNRYPDLAKQVVFITGAASGIGAAQAQAFLEQDAFVFGLDQKFGKMEELSFRFPETFAYALGMSDRGRNSNKRHRNARIILVKLRFY